MQGRRNKKLFWVSAIAPLISVILSTLIVFVSRADRHGVKIVKEVKEGLNPISIHQLLFNNTSILGLAAKAGLISALIALTVQFSLSNNNNNNQIKYSLLLLMMKVSCVFVSGSDCGRPVVRLD